jgi:hypothetical protein
VLATPKAGDVARGCKTTSFEELGFIVSAEETVGLTGAG